MAKAAVRRVGSLTKRSSKAPFDPLPSFVAPQLALLRAEAPTGDRWIHELKYDGYPLHARLDRGESAWSPVPASIGRIATEPPRKRWAAFPPIAPNLDGELCGVRSDGTTSFAAMQAATDAAPPTA